MAVTARPQFCRRFVSVSQNSARKTASRDEPWLLNDAKNVRHDVWAAVWVKASAVTRDAECKRKFVSLWNSEYIIGVVVKVVKQLSNSRKLTSLIRDWDILRTQKRKEVIHIGAVLYLDR